MTTIDDGAFGNLMAMTGDDPAFLARLIDAFLDTSGADVQSMRLAVATGDPELLRRAAHTLKSTSQSVGALALGSFAAQVEQQARAATFDGVDERLALLETELTAVGDELRRRRPAVGGGS